MRSYDWRQHESIILKHCEGWDGKGARELAATIIEAEGLTLSVEHFRRFLNNYHNEKTGKVAPESEEQTEWKETDSNATFQYVGGKPIRNLDEAKALMGHVDWNEWEISGQQFKTSQTPMKLKQVSGKYTTHKPIVVTSYHCTVQLRRKPQAQREMKELVELLKEDIRAYKAPTFNITHRIGGQKAGIINIFDAHIDKLALVEETNEKEDATIERNVEVFEHCFDVLLSACINRGCEEIYFPVGNDFWNTNGAQKTTKKGTPQETNTSHHRSTRIGTQVIRRCIDKARQVSSVKVPIIRGNHDEDKDITLGIHLEMLYEGLSDIELYTAINQRKYSQYGRNMFAFAHGNNEVRKIDQLPLLMAQEAPQMWADTTFREWYLGDQHHNFEYKFLQVKDYPGVLVRFLRSISTEDKWHNEMGYIGVPKSASAFIWDYDKGLTDTAQVNIK